MKKRILKRSVCVLFLLTLVQGAAFAAGSLSRLRQLEEQNQMPEAYALAKQMAKENAGTPDFDLLYAIAALNTNHPGEASFAFDRVLLVRPTDLRARFGFAQANFELKDNASAKKNFTEFLNQHPPSDLRLSAQDYLDKISEAEKKALTKTIAFARVEGGYDTNSNIAPAANFSTLPTGQLLPVLPSARPTPTAYNNIAVGLGMSRKVGNNKTFYFNLSDFQRINYAYKARRFNFGLGRAVAGFIATKGPWRFNFPLEFQMFSYGQSIFQNIYANGVEISRPFGNSVLGVFVQSQFLSYPQRRVRNGHLFLEAVDWLYRPRSLPLEFSTHLYAADGEAIDPISNYLANSYMGGQLLVRWNRFANVRPYASINYQHIYFKGRHPTFSTIRGDDFVNFVAGLEWRLTRYWYLTPTYSYARNFSNIPLNQTRRNLYQVGLEYRI